MGLLIPAPRASYNEGNYSGRPSLTLGTSVTASATPHALGTRVQVIAATARPYNRIRIQVCNTAVSATATDTLLSIYLGGSGSEVVLIPNLQAGYATLTTTTNRGHEWVFPVYIPKGSRISADARSVSASKVVSMMITLEQVDGAWSGAGVETLGANTAASRGTAVTPGTTSEGTLTSIGTTTRLWRAALVDLALGSSALTTACRMFGDIGTSGAAWTGLENFDFCLNANEFTQQESTFRPCCIPSGTALYARLQGHSTETGAKYVTLHGVYG